MPLFVYTSIIFLLFLFRQTILVFYKVMMSELEKAVRKIPAGKTSDNSEVSHSVHYSVFLCINLTV